MFLTFLYDIDDEHDYFLIASGLAGPKICLDTRHKENLSQSNWTLFQNKNFVTSIDNQNLEHDGHSIEFAPNVIENKTSSKIFNQVGKPQAVGYFLKVHTKKHYICMYRACARACVCLCIRYVLRNINHCLWPPQVAETQGRKTTCFFYIKVNILAQCDSLRDLFVTSDFCVSSSIPNIRKNSVEV